MRSIIKKSAWAPLFLASVAVLGASLAPPIRRAHADPPPPHTGFEEPLLPFPRPDPHDEPDFPVDVIVDSPALGYLPGVAGVSGTGAVTYNIDLAVPPGVRGMQPSLSLAYSSKGENGIAGVGWTLVGASQIERCHKTLRTDGVVDGFHFTDEDALCLNGTKLIRVGETPDGPEYRTEASPFDRIVHKLADNTFRIESSDGRISTYEPLSLPRNKVIDPNLDIDPANDSNVLAPWRGTIEPDGESVILWPLARVEDRYGNSMHYEYVTIPFGTPETGQGTGTLLQRITYTHHPSDPAGANREVLFVYEDRAQVDCSFRYVNGVRLNQNQRLQRIEMHAPSKPGGLKELQWRYNLRYLSDPSAKTGRTQLAGVKQCDAFGACGWEKQFLWQGQGQPLSIEASYSDVSEADTAPWAPCEPSGFSSNETRPILLDADGDGRQDVLLLHTHELDVCSNTIQKNKFKWKILLSSEGFAPHTVSNDFFFDNAAAQLTPGRYRVADVNNDGRDDLIAGFDEGDGNDELANESGWFRYRCYTWDSLASDFVSCMPHETKDHADAGDLDPRWPGRERIRWPLWNLADVDGDGRIDLIENDHIRRNLGTVGSIEVQFEPTSEPTDLIRTSDAPYQEIAWPWKAYNLGAEAVDIDGDGRTNLVFSNPPTSWVDELAGPDEQLSSAILNLHALHLDPGGWITGLPVPGLERGTGPWVKVAGAGMAIGELTEFFSVSADVNGDGLKDQVIVRHVNVSTSAGWDLLANGDDALGGIGTYVQYNTGRGFTPAVRTTMQFRPLEGWLLYGPLTAYDYGDDCPLQWMTGAYPAAVDVVDVNGDGRDDLVVKSMETWLWDPDQEELHTLVQPNIWPPVHAYDENNPAFNDGSAFWYTRIYLSTGRDFTLVENPFDPGLPTRDQSTNGYVYARPAQLDGDAAPEYIIRGRRTLPNGTPISSNDWLAGYVGETLNRVDLDAGPPEVIWAIQDQDAPEARDVFTYHDQGFSRTGEGCEYPISCPSSLPTVVDQHHTAQGRDKNGLPMYRRTKYKFYRPRIDLRGRGMLGFDEVRTIDLDSGATTISTYDANTTAVGEFFPYAGIPTEVKSFTPIFDTPDNGIPNLPLGSVRVRASDTVSTPAHKILYDGYAYFSYVSAETAHVVEKWMDLDLVDGEPRLHDIANPNQVLVSHVEKTSEYDNFANLTHSTTSIQGGETRQMDNTYINDTSLWLLHLPLTQSTTSLGRTRWASYGYDTTGHLQKIHVQPEDPDLSVRSTTYRVRDDRGLVFQIAEEAPGVLLRVTNLYHDTDKVFATQIINPLGHASIAERHPALGVPVLTKDALGVTSIAKYDTFGRLHSTDGPTELDIESIDYIPVLDANGHNIGIQTAAHRTDGSVQAVFTDSLGRPVRSAVTGFDGTMMHAATHYNLYGQTVTTTRMAAGAPSGYKTDFTYDTLGRVRSQSAPDDVVTVIEHDPFETRTTDALGHMRRVIYDVQHRPVESQEDVIVDGQGTTVITQFQYGAFDLLEGSIDPAGNPIDIRYDILGRKVYISDHDAGVTDFTYNGLGELRTKTTPQGQTITTDYDPLGRPLFVTDSDGTTIYAWDFAVNGIGQLAAAYSPDSVLTQYQYDDLGRLTTTLTTLDGTETFAVDQLYDAYGRLSQIAYPADPSGKRFNVFFGFNAHGYPESVSRTNLAPPNDPQTQPVWQTLDRDENLALTKGLLGNDIVTVWDRDPITGMVEKIAAEPLVAPVGAPPKFEVSYVYDSLRNVKIREWGGSAFSNDVISESFEYDALDRLTQWEANGPVINGAGLRRYRYDTMGNLTMVQENGATVYTATHGKDGHPNALATSTFGNSYSYDAGGRQTQANNRTVTFTDFDMPRSATVDGDTTTFRYGPDGRRIEKTTPDGRTVYIGGLYEKRITPTETQHVFFIPGDAGIAAQVTRTQPAMSSLLTEETLYFARDHLGSSSAAFDDNGDVTAQLFDPWGERIYVTGGTPLLSDVHHGFTDQRHEDDLGWIDMNARMYDPLQRRFISPDPLVADPLFSTGRNRFAYALNNPLRYTDPSGLGVDQTIDSTPVSVPTQRGDVLHLPPVQIQGMYHRDTRGAQYQRGAAQPKPDTNGPHGDGASGVQPTPPRPIERALERVAKDELAASMFLEGIQDAALNMTLGAALFAFQTATPGTSTLLGMGNLADGVLNPPPAPVVTGDPTADAAINLVPITRIAGGFVRTGCAIANGDPHGAGEAIVPPAVELISTAMMLDGGGAAAGVGRGGGGGTVKLFHGSRTWVGEAFDLTKAAAGKRQFTSVAGIYLTDDPLRAATQYGRGGVVVVTEVPTDFAQSIRQTGGLPAGLPEYFVATDEGVRILNQNIRIYDTHNFLQVWKFSGVAAKVGNSK